MSIRIILLLSFTWSLNAYAQTKEQKKVEKDFVIEFCGCLETFAKSEPDKILYSASEECIRSIMAAKTDEFVQIVNSRQYKGNLSDYEKGSIVGKEIMFNTIDDLVKDCVFYRRTLNEYKT